MRPAGKIFAMTACVRSADLVPLQRNAPYRSAAAAISAFSPELIAGGMLPILWRESSTCTVKVQPLRFFARHSRLYEQQGEKNMALSIGILTAGGDSPGLNAAIRGVGKAAMGAHGMHVIGFRDGFRGLMQDRVMRLTGVELSGILTVGGTILGTSRDKPQRMAIGAQMMDMTSVMLDTYRKHNLDALVCLGGGGTQKNAYHLMQHGLNVVTLPKTIDNDVAMTDMTFGFDTALGIATEAIDRLHSTAHSHHRIIVVELMGHNAGWLALGAGLAGGADVILIPEIPYDVSVVANAIKQRNLRGSGFSIVAVSEGALTLQEADALAQSKQKVVERAAKNEAAADGEVAVKEKKKKQKEGAPPKSKGKPELAAAPAAEGKTMLLARQLEELTGLETRVTILGYLQRGGTPSAADRLLATRLGTACADVIARGEFGVMVAACGDTTATVPLEQVVGKRKTVPLDHGWLKTARDIGVCLGD
jgi:6-phosphofructokinase 1